MDRGSFSCEVALLLLALKVANPQKVYLIRGNHETANQTAACGFKVSLDEDGWRLRMGVKRCPILVAFIELRSIGLVKQRPYEQFGSKRGWQRFSILSVNLCDLS